MQTTLKDLKKGAYFTFKDIEYPNENQVYVKCDYDRTDKSYTCICFSDINKSLCVKGNKAVYIGFTF